MWAGGVERPCGATGGCRALQDLKSKGLKNAVCYFFFSDLFFSRCRKVGCDLFITGKHQTCSFLSKAS